MIDFSDRPVFQRYAALSSAVAKAPSLVELKDLLVANEGWLRVSPADRAAIRRMVEIKLEALS